MKKIMFVFLIIGIFIFGIVIVNSETNNKISPEVKGLEDNGSLRVVINIKEPAKEEGFIFKRVKTDEEIEQEKKEIKDEIINQVGEEDVKHVFDKQVAVEVTKEDLNVLKLNPNIEFIRIDRVIVAFLSDSVPLVNATRTWLLQFSGLNLTGAGETICIIDTGVNFSHPDLLGKNLTCNIDCVGKSCLENCSVTDDNGHGTHVSGIAGANGSLKGVAIGANIIGVKVLNSAGDGAGSDLDAGIDWCVANANTYNISVISMSLGTPCKYSNGTETGWCYNSYCDNVSSEQSTAIRIDNATSRNISVIVATGNNANFTHISSPACVKNATAVGWANKDDSISGNSNRNNITDLFAPGSSINSTMIPNPGGTVLSSCGTGKSYCALSGTSMAAPHVAGAFAIVRQFFRAQNIRVPAPLEIETILNATGKIISDPQSGLNFSRINIYAAILSLDSTPPNATLIAPGNNSINTTLNQTFSCNASDFQLSNITFYLWNSSNSLVYNETKNITGTVNTSIFNVANLNYSTYSWNCKAVDLNNYSAFASSNFSFTLKYLSVNLSSPENNLVTNQNQSYNCTFNSQESKALVNSTFYVWNSSNILIYNTTQNVSGTSISSLFNYNFSLEGNYSWNCNVINNNSESALGDSNFSIKYDVTFPIISLLALSVTATTAAISWNSSEITNSSIIYGINSANLNLNNSNSSFALNHSVFLTGLTSSTTYHYNLTYCDNAGNCITNGTNNFTTSTTPAAGSGTGGGGSTGGGVSSNSYSVKSEEISAGYTQELNKNDKLIFSFPQENVQTAAGGGGHSLIINEVKENYVNMTIRSNPVTFILFIGESKKLNLSSPDFYDLYVKLGGIINNKAKITIKTIHEEIVKNNISKSVSNEKPMNNSENNKIIDNDKELGINIQNAIIIIVTSIISVIIVIIVMLSRKYRINIKINKKEKVIKEYKNVFNSHIRSKKL